MKRTASILLLITALTGVLYAAESTSSVDSTAIRAITAAIAGKNSDQSAKTEAAITAALKNDATLAAMQDFSKTRKAYLIDRRKTPAERDASLEKRYQQSLSTTVEIVRKAIGADTP